MKKKLLILGGGISGIAAAKAAEEKNLDYLLIEKAQSLGGLTRSMYIGEYIFDYTGHFLHLVNFNSPADIAGSFNQADWGLINKNAKCFYKGNIIDAPFQYNIKQLPESLYIKFINSFLISDKIQKSENTFSDYLINNFGNEIANEFLIPYNQKLLSTNLSRISKDAVTRFFPPPIKDLVIKSAKVVPKTYNSTFWYPKKNGIQLLVDSLIFGIPKNKIITNSEVEMIDLEKKNLITNRDNFKYDDIISSVPLNVFIKKCPQLKSFNKYLKNDITAGTVLSFHIGVRGKLQKRYEGIHWIYFSEKNYPFYRVGFYSNFNDYMAPKNSYSMYVEVGVDSKEIELKTIITNVLDSLEKLQLLKKRDIDLLIYNFMVDGYVHYTHSRNAVLERISNQLEKNNIFQIGRYGKWQYSSMEDSIKEGYESINKI
jgi:protoporphyrinogen oxidase